MDSLNDREGKLTFAILSIIILLGAVVRLYDLTERTITHIEIYVPGIELPSDLSVPGPRFTVKQTLVELMIAQEPCPPAHYLLMLGLTKILGSGMLVLRIPSVLFGLGAIILVSIIGFLENYRAAGLLAAGMLAFNGHHVFWSQLAKMYMMGCFLGLASTALLLLICRGGSNRRHYLFLYLVSTLIGLATTVWFWPILFTHILWTFMKRLGSKTLPGLLRWQWAILILGSPLLSLSIFQSRRPSYLNQDPLVLLGGLGRYLEFGFLFEPDGHSVPPTKIPILLSIAIVLIALFLIRLGLVSSKKLDKQHTVVVAPSSKFIVLASVFSFLFILRMARFTYGFSADRTRLVVASSLVPFFLLIVDFLICRYWRYLQDLGRSLHHRLNEFHTMTTLSSALAILPITMIILISLIISLFASRGLLLYSPFLLLVLSRGFVEIIQKSRLWLFVAAFLMAIHLLSITHYKNLHHEHPTNYKGLAEQWMLEVHDTDLIFVERHWATTPIFYYLKADRYHFIGNDYAQELIKRPDSRVWVLSLEGIPMAPAMEEALKEYSIQNIIEARWIRAILYSM